MMPDQVQYYFQLAQQHQQSMQQQQQQQQSTPVTTTTTQAQTQPAIQQIQLPGNLTLTQPSHIYCLPYNKIYFCKLYGIPCST